MFVVGTEYLRSDLLEFVGSRQGQSGIIWGTKQPDVVLCISGGRHGAGAGYDDGIQPGGSWHYFGQVRLIRFRGHLPKSAPENFGKVLPIAMTPPGGKGWGAVSTMSPRRGTIGVYSRRVVSTDVESLTLGVRGV